MAKSITVGPIRGRVAGGGVHGVEAVEAGGAVAAVAAVADEQPGTPPLPPGVPGTVGLKPSPPLPANSPALPPLGFAAVPSVPLPMKIFTNGMAPKSSKMGSKGAALSPPVPKKSRPPVCSGAGTTGAACASGAAINAAPGVANIRPAPPIAAAVASNGRFGFRDRRSGYLDYYVWTFGCPLQLCEQISVPPGNQPSTNLGYLHLCNSFSVDLNMAHRIDQPHSCSRRNVTIRHISARQEASRWDIDATS